MNMLFKDTVIYYLQNNLRGVLVRLKFLLNLKQTWPHVVKGGSRSEVEVGE